MTKGEIIESVLLAVNGGKLSADIDVRREDIEVMTSPAISMALQDYIDKSRRRDLERLRNVGAVEGVPVAQFASTYLLTPVLDNTRELYQITLPGRLFPLPAEMGIEMVAPKLGRRAYTKVNSQAELAGIPDIGFTFYWHEIVNNESRIYFDGLGSPVCEIVVKMLLDPQGYGLDEEIPLPSGVDLQAIDLLTAHFRGQRMMPQDNKLDDVDATRSQNAN